MNSRRMSSSPQVRLHSERRCRSILNLFHHAFLADLSPHSFIGIYDTHHGCRTRDIKVVEYNERDWARHRSCGFADALPRPPSGLRDCVAPEIPSRLYCLRDETDNSFIAKIVILLPGTVSHQQNRSGPDTRPLNRRSDAFKALG